MQVSVLSCPGCESQLHGSFSLPVLARLPKELQEVVMVFLRCRGNIKEVERELGISYPTVSKKLDAINYLLGAMPAVDANRSMILRRLEAGEIAVADAIAQLKSLDTTRR